MTEWALHEAVFDFLKFGSPRGPPSSITKNSTKHENDNISVTAEWILTKFVTKSFLHLVVSKITEYRPVILASVTKIAKRKNDKTSAESDQFCIRMVPLQISQVSDIRSIWASCFLFVFFQC